MVMATEPDILNVWSPTCLKAKIFLRILNHFDVNNKKKTRNIIKKSEKKKFYDPLWNCIGRFVFHNNMGAILFVDKSP